MKGMRGKSECVLAIAVSVVAGFWPCEPAFAGRIVAWGWNYYGQCDVPQGNDFVAISARFKHNLALRADGTIEGWGQNNHGQSDPPAGNDYVAIAAGTVHSLALKADGSLVAWGYNGNGECQVPAGNGFTAIAAGSHHNLALRPDGTFVGWGDNGCGECDVPEEKVEKDEEEDEYELIPITDFTAIAAGHRFSVGIRSDGSLVAWGYRYGQCDVPEGNDFVAIAAGSLHALALRSDGSLVAWGSNNHGQCDVPEGNDFVAIAADAHSLALRSDGSIVAWGGQETHLGQCDVPSLKNFIAVAAGGRHSVALLEGPTTGHPIADAGSDVVASANEEITLDASNSHDPGGEIISYTWKRLPDEVVIYSGEEPTCKTRALGRAEEVIELTVTDNDYITTSDTVRIISRMLQNLRDRLDSTDTSDLNLDRSVNMLDLALLTEKWLE